MSHTSHDAMRELVATIRAVEEEAGRPIGILVDLQGPKLRLGNIRRGRRPRSTRATSSSSTPIRRPATPRACNLPHPEIFAASSRATAC